jgi:CheY-like chemotaxis protein
LNDSPSLPDLILTDLEMPGMDGFQFISAGESLREAKKYSGDRTFYAVRPVNRSTAFRLGAVECFEKPLDRPKLRLIASALRNP